MPLFGFAAVVQSTAIDLNDLACCIHERERNATAKMFMAGFSQDANTLKAIAQSRTGFVALLGWNAKPQASIDEADFEFVD